VIDGTVISMNKREVVINIGYKSEGIISLSEFRFPTLQLRLSMTWVQPLL